MKNGILVSLVIIGCVIGTVLHADDLFGFKNSEDDLEMLLYKQSINEITIDTAAAAVEIKEGDEFGIRLGEGKGLRYSLEEGRLRVTQENHSFIGFGDDRDYRVYIYIPKDHKLDNLSIKTTAGAVKISDTAADSMTVKSEAGAMEIKNTECPAYTLETTVGAIEMDLNGDIDDYTIHSNTAVGAVSVNGSSYKNGTTNGVNILNVSTTVGAIDIEID